jgi:hypothetical protein
MDELTENLIKQTEIMIERGKYLKAGELLIGAYAYRESGMLMATEEAISFLEMRYPEIKNTLQPFKEGDETQAREKVVKLLEFLRG